MSPRHSVGLCRVARVIGIGAQPMAGTRVFADRLDHLVERVVIALDDAALVRVSCPVLQFHLTAFGLLDTRVRFRDAIRRVGRFVEVTGLHRGFVVAPRRFLVFGETVEHGRDSARLDCRRLVLSRDGLLTSLGDLPIRFLKAPGAFCLGALDLRLQLGDAFVGRDDLRFGFWLLADDDVRRCGRRVLLDFDFCFVSHVSP